MTGCFPSQDVLPASGGIGNLIAAPLHGRCRQNGKSTAEVHDYHDTLTPVLAGAESRANYLLKWEAIRSSRERGATSYDLWGLATGGIAHFKAGFGGREVHYVGAWDLVLDPLGRRTYLAAQRGSTWLARRRAGLPTAGGATSAAAFEGDE